MYERRFYLYPNRFKTYPFVFLLSFALATTLKPQSSYWWFLFISLVCLLFSLSLLNAFMLIVVLVLSICFVGFSCRVMPSTRRLSSTNILNSPK